MVFLHKGERFGILVAKGVECMDIRMAAREDMDTVAALACRLWPHHTLEEILEEHTKLLGDGRNAFFLAWEGGAAAGWAHVFLRRDYVEGTDYSPVGFLEAIYVEPEYRRQGVARALLSTCEDWARAQGCREFASDCELTNEQSQRFHQGVGFAEANRIVCFVKPLGDRQ